MVVLNRYLIEDTYCVLKNEFADTIKNNPSMVKFDRKLIYYSMRIKLNRETTTNRLLTDLILHPILAGLFRKHYPRNFNLISGKIIL